MPYVSDAQRRFFHSPGAKKAGISADTVKEWDAASKGQRGLPSRVQRKAAGGFVVHTENPDHFIARGRSGDFRIAKAGLRPERVAYLQRMCQGGKVKRMAGGGKVLRHAERVGTGELVEVLGEGARHHATSGAYRAEAEPDPRSEQEMGPEGVLARREDFLRGLGESAVSVGAGMVAMPVAGLAGLGELARGKGLERAAHTMEKVERALSYEPKSVSGKAITSTLGAPIAAGNRLAEVPGDLALKAGADPAVAAALTTAGQAALMYGMGKLGPKETPRRAPRAALVHQTSEYIPGVASGHLAHLKDMPETVKGSFTRAVAPIDEGGRNLFWKALGKKQLPVDTGEGSFVEGGKTYRNPNVTSHVAMEVKEGTGRLTPESASVADIVSSWEAALYGQTAAATNAAAPAAGAEYAALQVRFPKALSKAQVRALQAEVEKAGLTIIDDGGGRFLVSGDYGQMPAVPFQARAAKLNGALNGAKVRNVVPEVGYRELPWAPEGSGRLTRWLMERTPPAMMDLLDRSPELRAKLRQVNAIENEFARSLPVGRPRLDIQRLRSALGEVGWNGLREYVKKNGFKGLPAVFAAPGIADALLSDDEPQKMDAGGEVDPYFGAEPQAIIPDLKTVGSALYRGAGEIASGMTPEWYVAGTRALARNPSDPRMAYAQALEEVRRERGAPSHEQKVEDWRIADATPFGQFSPAYRSTPTGSWEEQNAINMAGMYGGAGMMPESKYGYVTVSERIDPRSFPGGRGTQAGGSTLAAWLRRAEAAGIYNRSSEDVSALKPVWRKLHAALKLEKAGDSGGANVLKNEILDLVNEIRLKNGQEVFENWAALDAAFDEGAKAMRAARLHGSKKSILPEEYVGHSTRRERYPTSEVPTENLTTTDAFERHPSQYATDYFEQHPSEKPSSTPVTSPNAAGGTPPKGYENPYHTPHDPRFPGGRMPNDVGNIPYIARPQRTLNGQVVESLDPTAPPGPILVRRYPSLPGRADTGPRVEEMVPYAGHESAGQYRLFRKPPSPSDVSWDTNRALYDDQYRLWRRTSMPPEQKGVYHQGEKSLDATPPPEPQVIYREILDHPSLEVAGQNPRVGEIVPYAGHESENQGRLFMRERNQPNFIPVRGARGRESFPEVPLGHALEMDLFRRSEMPDRMREPVQYLGARKRMWVDEPAPEQRYVPRYYNRGLEPMGPNAAPGWAQRVQEPVGPDLTLEGQKDLWREWPSGQLFHPSELGPAGRAPVHRNPADNMRVRFEDPTPPASRYVERKVKLPNGEEVTIAEKVGPSDYTGSQQPRLLRPNFQGNQVDAGPSAPRNASGHRIGDYYLWRESEMRRDPGLEPLRHGGEEPKPPITDPGLIHQRQLYDPKFGESPSGHMDPKQADLAMVNQRRAAVGQRPFENREEYKAAFDFGLLSPEGRNLPPVGYHEPQETVFRSDWPATPKPPEPTTYEKQPEYDLRIRKEQQQRAIDAYQQAQGLGGGYLDPKQEQKRMAAILAQHERERLVALVKSGTWPAFRKMKPNPEAGGLHKFIPDPEGDIVLSKTTTHGGAPSAVAPRGAFEDRIAASEYGGIRGYKGWELGFVDADGNWITRVEKAQQNKDAIGAYVDAEGNMVNRKTEGARPVAFAENVTDKLAAAPDIVAARKAKAERERLARAAFFKAKADEVAQMQGLMRQMRRAEAMQDPELREALGRSYARGGKVPGLTPEFMDQIQRALAILAQRRGEAR